MEVRLGDIIAARSFTDKGSGKEIKLLFGMPQPFDGTDNFYCPYMFVGVGNEEVKYACGVDAVQAIQLAFKKASYELEYYNRELARIKWVAGEEGDWGL